MDQTLRARIRASEPDAFGALFDECARKVYNHAYRMTGSWSLAEEVVALTFLEAWRLRTTITPEGGPLLPWVLGICVNVTRNISRTERRHRAVISRLPPPSSVPDFADDVAGRLDAAAAAQAAMSSLNRQEREVVGLYVWAGLSYREAAEALGVPVGTVRSRLSRARNKLAKRALGVPPLPSSEKTEPPSRLGQIPDDRQENRAPEGGKPR